VRTALLVAAMAAVAACAARPQPEDDAERTVRGVISVVGSAPQEAVLLTAEGAAPVALVGEQARLLRPLAGLDVEVAARASQHAAPPSVVPGTALLDVQHFTVVAAHGSAAHDGILLLEDGAYMLRLRSGERVPVGALPPVLQQHVGARVFLAGPLDRSPAVYGIIQLAPRR
jgi:hypothetical protein